MLRFSQQILCVSTTLLLTQVISAAPQVTLLNQQNNTQGASFKNEAEQDLIANESVPPAKVVVNQSSGLPLENTSEYIDLSMNVKINDEVAMNPQLKVKNGEKATFSQSSHKDSYFIEVKAQKNEIAPNGQVSTLLDLTVGEINADGNKEILSSPQVYVFKNKANIIVGSIDKKTKEENELSIDIDIK